MATVRKLPDHLASLKKLKALPGRFYYLLDYIDPDGKRKQRREYLFPRQAKLRRAELIFQEEMIRQGILHEVKQTTPMSEVVIEYKRTKEIDDWNSDDTRRIFDNTVKSFYRLTPITPRSRISEITKQIIRQYVANRRTKDGVRKTTINIDVRNLNTFFSWAVENSYLLESPMRSIKQLRTNKEESVKPFMTLDDFKRVLLQIRMAGDIDAYEHLIFLFITGRRVSETLRPNFTWDDFRGDHVILHTLKRGRQLPPIKLPDQLRSILERRLKEGQPYPFPYKNKDDAYKKIVIKYFHKIGLKGFSFHSLRKIAGTEIENIYDASVHLGHTNIATTNTFYRQPKSERITEVMKSLEKKVEDLEDVNPLRFWVDYAIADPFGCILNLGVLFWEESLPVLEELGFSGTDVKSDVNDMIKLKDALISEVDEYDPSNLDVFNTDKFCLKAIGHLTAIGYWARVALLRYDEKTSRKFHENLPSNYPSYDLSKLNRLPQTPDMSPVFSSENDSAQRRGRDSNPRYGVTAHTLSKRAPSAARPPLQQQNQRAKF